MMLQWGSPPPPELSRETLFFGEMMTFHSEIEEMLGQPLRGFLPAPHPNLVMALLIFIGSACSIHLEELKKTVPSPPPIQVGKHFQPTPQHHRVFSSFWDVSSHSPDSGQFTSGGSLRKAVWKDQAVEKIRLLRELMTQ